jgi:hypothetical protein
MRERTGSIRPILPRAPQLSKMRGNGG